MNKRKLHELDLFCRAGMGLEPIAPVVCRLLRELVGAEAASLFWMDERGMPAGFHHEDSPDSARDLFINEFERLFVGEHEINVHALARYTGSAMGKLLTADAAYFKSNTFNMLVRPSGHHHALDLRVELDGKPRLIVLLFRGERQPFRNGDVKVLALTEASLRRAVASPPHSGEWRSDGRRGYLIVSGDDSRITLMGGDATAILRNVNLVGQGVRLDSPITLPPLFVRQACALAATEDRPVHRAMVVPTGRLQMVAEPLRAPAQPGAGSSVLVSLELHVPARLSKVEHVIAAGLSPLQQRIALVAAAGGSRQDSLNTLGLSNEALKKHLAVVYERFAVNGWEALSRAI